MKIGKNFGVFIRELLKRDKHAAIPTKRQYKRITEKAARRIVWPVARCKHVVPPVKPFSW